MKLATAIATPDDHLTRILYVIVVMARDRGYASVFVSEGYARRGTNPGMAILDLYVCVVVDIPADIK